MKVNVEEILLPRNDTAFNMQLVINGADYHYSNIVCDKENEEDHKEDWEYLDWSVPELIQDYKDYIEIDNAWQAFGHGHIDYYEKITKFMKGNKDLFKKYSK